MNGIKMFFSKLIGTHLPQCTERREVANHFSPNSAFICFPLEIDFIDIEEPMMNDVAHVTQKLKLITTSLDAKLTAGKPGNANLLNNWKQKW